MAQKTVKIEVIDPQKGMNLYKKIVDEAAANNTFSIKLSWRGEPMLHPKLMEMIKYAKDKDIKIAIRLGIRNEGNFLEEWIQYYISLGFNNLFNL